MNCQPGWRCPKLTESCDKLNESQIMNGVMPLNERLELPAVIDFFAVLPWDPITPIQYTLSLAVPEKTESVCLANWCFRDWIPPGQCCVFLISLIKTVRNVRGVVDSLMTSMMKSGMWVWSSLGRHCWGVTMYPWEEGKRPIRIVFQGPYQASSVSGGSAVKCSSMVQVIASNSIMMGQQVMLSKCTTFLILFHTFTFFYFWHKWQKKMTNQSHAAIVYDCCTWLKPICTYNYMYLYATLAVFFCRRSQELPCLLICASMVYCCPWAKMAYAGWELFYPRSTPETTIEMQGIVEFACEYLSSWEHISAISAESEPTNSWRIIVVKQCQ